HYYITRRCVFKCRMCSIWKYGDIKEEPPLEKIAELARRLRKIGTANVVFTGGEPFMRKELPEIARIFTNAGIAVRVQTTGSKIVTPERLDAVIDGGAEYFTVSLDTLDPAKQDAICQTEGLWDSAVNSIKHIVSRLPNSVNVVNTVVSRANIEELPQMVEFVDGLGAYSSLVPVHLLPSAEQENLIRNYAEEMTFKPGDAPLIDKAYDAVIAMKRKGAKVGASMKFLEASRAALKTGDYGFNCDAGRLYFVVFPDGSLSPCDEIEPFCNVFDDNFLSYFGSPEYRKKVESLVKPCPGCIYGCWRETSYLIRDSRVLLERVLSFIK
ncbi:MAG: radical SAM protein, partial [Candidatus Coatesbacteria bacterium]|nr:radical SAM protein [Candidatus Coatesbacteria bacterium]